MPGGYVRDIIVSKLTNQAKQLIHKRGGMESLKDDAKELKSIATKDESLVDKVKDAASALKDPGAGGNG